MRGWPKQFLRREGRRGAGAAAPLVLAPLLLLLLGGCASPGVPRPPSLHLPAVVRDLSALRSGDTVVLRFTAPDQTTDRQALTRKGAPAPLTAVVCRVQGASCLPLARLAVAAGQAVTTADTLPPALTVGPGRPVAYRVRVENAAGRDAGDSADALAAAGAAPPPMLALAAVTVAGGIQLTWRPVAGEHDPVRVEAVTETASADTTAPAGSTPRQRNSRAERLLQVPSMPRDPAGAIDTAPPPGARVQYRVYRRREVLVGGLVLPMEGAPATLTAVRSADVFAPAAPTGLLALSVSVETSGPEVSLSWEPGSEPDVAGYYVYRSVAGGPYARLPGGPVAGVSFTDTARTGLPAGTHLRYAVTAVDRAGNESGRSAPADADVP